jgi:hypothetical protein
MDKRINILFHVIRNVLVDPAIEKVHGSAEAYKYGWEKMRKYRTTGRS